MGLRRPLGLRRVLSINKEVKPGYMPPYPPWYIHHPTTPWVYQPPYYPDRLDCTSTLRCSVHGERALGSEREKDLGREPPSLLRS